MSNVTVQEALNEAFEALLPFADCLQYIEIDEDDEEWAKFRLLIKNYRQAAIAYDKCKAALSELDKCEPVAQAIRERDRLGFAVVNVIGKLDEIIENTQEVEIDDFLHIAVPIDMWNELQDALEDMPKRADLFTSPQPIEKCEPVAWRYEDYKGSYRYRGFVPNFDINYKILKPVPLYTSPISKEWLSLTDGQKLELKENNDWYNFPLDLVNATEAKCKQLNFTK